MTETAPKPTRPDSSEPSEKPKPTGLRKLWVDVIRPIAVVILIVTTFRSAVADWNDVPSQSMEPNILIGDRIFVNRLAYDLKIPFTTWHIAEWSAPERGDIIVFYSPADGTRMVKRVVAIPGDTVELRHNKLYINDEVADYGPAQGLGIDFKALSDPGPHVYAREAVGGITQQIMLQPRRPARRTMDKVTVPADQFFVLGDNRDNSGDSRLFGFVHRDDVLGRAVGLAFSLDKNKTFSPRWDRFFRGLN